LENPTLAQLSDYLDRQFGRQKEPAAAKADADDAATKGVSTLVEDGGLESEPIDRTAKGEAAAAGIEPSETAVRAPKSTNAPVAVIGLWCHFPDAKSPGAFWHNLMSGRCSIRETPSNRWDVARHFNPAAEPGETYGKWGAFIDDIDYFDPAFFGIDPEDAPHIDPLARQFLENATQAIRHAGHDAKEWWGRKVGVFVGSRISNFAAKVGPFRKNSIIGVGQNFIAAYLSHLHNFTGPNMVIDTACSSSLVSIHQACNSLAFGECEVALAGGVDILLDEHPFKLLSGSKALSPDGVCRPFDAQANGIVPGEGCGVVVLKSLQQAVSDGDRVLAVIEASAVNNDGRTMGATTPSLEGQKAVVREALARGGIDPGSIDYVEAHGTGTMIGDPIELKALTHVFRESTDQRQFCAVGSVKSNIGHLLSSAGVASFIKTTLALHERKIPPTLNCETPNPRFNFDNSPFYPNVDPSDWPLTTTPRAGISSFGFGGTNCHMLLAGFTQLDTGELHQPLAPIRFNKQRYWPQSLASDDHSDAPSPTRRRLLALERGQVG
jgi:acyl transferase domain-containing protein